ncbi:archaellin/type IV pilin N-terminal domain-containing protein [Haloprofundus salinisoli]|uniref:archaellin/type IV pilin N-terminal domain-containing protein n=1 Tax=Haloprofundus salinisoli TaxID=2876193 RepID=UPI001CCD302E|nr:archaellin/type IV pilin N-terminal domain-containing protein [Haloprofundus salinisoli]
MLPFNKSNDRGQVGIETLIIFIAMILVAAVAAGVLINTAGFLQNQATATSQDSSEQVSNQVLVASAVGDVGADDDGNPAITDLHFTVMQSPGAGEIDMGDATVEFIGPDGKTTLLHGGEDITNVEGDEFSVSELKGESTVPVLTSKSDRFEVGISLDTNGGPEVLGEGSSATVRFVTQSGSQYTYIVNVPESLSSAEGSSVEV